MYITDTSVITATGLTKTYEGASAVQDLSLTVPRHSIFGFLGSNDAGKSTTGARWVINLAVAEGAICRRLRSQYVPSAMNAV